MEPYMTQPVSPASQAGKTNEADGEQRITQSERPAQPPSEPTPEPPGSTSRTEPVETGIPPGAHKDLPEGEYGTADIMQKPKT
jgi:hypothetical protein